jgi:acyl dehydratase
LSEAVDTTPLPKKLGITPGFTVALLAAPRRFAAGLKPLPDEVRFTARPEAGADLFVSATTQTMWLAWPKRLAFKRRRR